MGKNLYINQKTRYRLAQCYSLNSGMEFRDSLPIQVVKSRGTPKKTDCSHGRPVRSYVRCKNLRLFYRDQPPGGLELSNQDPPLGKAGRTPSSALGLRGVPSGSARPPGWQ
jgi:hypothetical protein